MEWKSPKIRLIFKWKSENDFLFLDGSQKTFSIFVWKSKAFFK